MHFSLVGSLAKNVFFLSFRPGLSTIWVPSHSGRSREFLVSRWPTPLYQPTGSRCPASRNLKGVALTARKRSLKPDRRRGPTVCLRWRTSANAVAKHSARSMCGRCAEAAVLLTDIWLGLQWNVKSLLLLRFTIYETVSSSKLTDVNERTACDSSVTATELCSWEYIHVELEDNIFTYKRCVQRQRKSLQFLLFCMIFIFFDYLWHMIVYLQINCMKKQNKYEKRTSLEFRTSWWCHCDVIWQLKWTN